MTTIESNSMKGASTEDFSKMYNKWLQELNAVERSIKAKASEIQSLQTNLSEDAEMLRGVSNSLLPLQVEQNSLQDYVNSLSKLQDELEKEIISLNDMELPSDNSEQGEYEESPITIEATEIELQKITETVKKTVNKINSELNLFEKTHSPLTKFRIIMDRYTDALQLLEKNSCEIQDKLNELNSIYLQHYINTDPEH
ncbi:uncharacterized protein LOC135842796 [Planococcus citri]|uniref:uncharacterized protein LOC135842796 n=1 Tax=Planococcus citri TaxID=170843 RepID=UPI0031F81D09